MAIMVTTFGSHEGRRFVESLRGMEVLGVTFATPAGRVTYRTDRAGKPWYSTRGGRHTSFEAIKVTSRDDTGLHRIELTLDEFVRAVLEVHDPIKGEQEVFILEGNAE